MTCKLYAWTTQHFFLYTCQMAAEAAGIDYEVIIPTEEQKAEPAFKAKKAHGKYPMLELADGTIIFESVAIAAYFCNQGKPALMGANAFQNAQVNQWTAFATSTLDPILRGLIYNVFGFTEDAEVMDKNVNAVGPVLAMIEKSLAGRTHFVGNSITLADFTMFQMLLCPLVFCVDPAAQAHIPNVCAWFNMMRTHEHVVSVCGIYKLCQQAFKVAGATATVNCAPVAAAAAAAEEEDEMDDLFGDDDDEDDAKDIAAQLRGKAFEAKKAADNLAKGKAAVAIAKSLILWEVKPVDDETDLDVLGNRIINDIKMEGLHWKTEFKKAPIAFGIFKLIIGATIEDALVSTDDVEEKMAEMDDMVQSIDIQSFNKL